MQNKEYTQITNQFINFHKQNPNVYNLFKRFTKQAIKAGHTHLSSEMIINRIRWETSITTNEEYKINNIYKPYYSRMFMNDFPKYNEFFRMRTSYADEVDFSTIEKE
jgi:hypothetical protein|tara:strand:- start:622 stop:942 length:321 start_codon:yes stop_codon:yes gene_type:complete